MALPLAFAWMVTACTSSPGDQPSTASTAASDPILTTTLRSYAQPLVPVTIDGRPYHFILDTGAPYTFIDNHSAAAITQRVPNKEVPEYFRDYVGGLNVIDGSALNQEQVLFWQSKPILVGSHPISGSVPWIGLDLSTVDMAYGAHVDGLLGANAFRQLNWGFDNIRHTLTVWSQPPSTAGYEQCAPYGDAFGSSPFLNILFANGNGGPMTIDTGSSFSASPPEHIQTFKEQGGNVQEIGKYARLSGNGVYEAAAYLVDGLHLGNMPLGRLQVFGGKEGASSTLGMNFLSRFDSYAFIPSEMLFCFSAKHFTRDDPKPVRLVELSYENGHLLIGSTHLSRDGLPQGLVSDDILLSVNGKPVEPVDIEAIRHQLAHAPAGELTLQVERQGKQMTVKL
ncbi:aspartyl protease family protein [Dyella silvae]|uniref:aspartyl protease family protein n=1 Tax=Dyella silvae TaxID=2994424 RepID=UPI0022641BCB|nr:aspartyl protease family protein [Dyella silvae]